MTEPTLRELLTEAADLLHTARWCAGKLNVEMVLRGTIARRAEFEALVEAREPIAECMTKISAALAQPSTPPVLIDGLRVGETVTSPGGRVGRVAEPVRVDFDSGHGFYFASELRRTPRRSVPGLGLEAAHAAISRALDEANIRNEVYRGMCLEVGLEKFAEAIAALSQSLPPAAL